eukprot:5862485-Amphidinium_carterae.1
MDRPPHRTVPHRNSEEMTSTRLESISLICHCMRIRNCDVPLSFALPCSKMMENMFGYVCSGRCIDGNTALASKVRLARIELGIRHDWP